MSRLTFLRSPRSLLTIALAIVGIWYSLAATLATVLGTRNYAAATSMGLASADALHTQAQFLLTQGGGNTNDLQRARSFALQAMKRDPLDVDAMQTLAQIESLKGESKLAKDLYLAAEDLSRRETSIQFWLIEDAASRGDIATALHHYDRALRTSRRSGALLLSILAKAANNDIVSNELAAMLVHRPPWWPNFFDQYLRAATNPGALHTITSALDLQLDEEGERQLLQGALQRLVQMGAYREAGEIYAIKEGAAATLRGTIGNGSFDYKSVTMPPFGWSLNESYELAGSIEPRPGTEDTNLALMIASEPGASGEVARQLLMLEPARYEISMLLGDMPARTISRPFITITCASSPPRAIEKTLTNLRFEDDVSTKFATVRRSFEVPEECPAQLLQIRVRSGADRSERPWIDDIKLTRLVSLNT